MELIMLVNLAFSVVGFFFIIRMWREVKSRRDYYGENFGIPRGIDRTEAVQPAKQSNVSKEDLVAALAMLGACSEPEPEPEEEPMQFTQGDLQQMMAIIAQAQGGKS